MVLPSKYQVWSSVLGKSLTTVDTQENKLETQVYAGGALIATQVRSTMSDNVVFHTADPVTGTTMLMGDNGTYTYKEESEPLGQRIEPVDPSPGYPDEYTEITDIASQPNWNCALMKEVSGGFFNMPVECQKKEAQMMYFSIEGALQSMEPENPQRVADLAAPGVAGGHSSPAAASTETTLSTQKPPDCDETDTEDTIRICTQEPRPARDIPGFVDASEEGESERQNQTRKNHLTDTQLDKIREQIPNALTDDCVDYINKLVRAHTENEKFDARKDLLETFDYVRKQSPGFGFIWGDGNHAGKKEVSLVRPEAGYSGVVRGINIMTVIHELIHTYVRNVPGRKGSDDDLSQTVNALGIKVYRDNGTLMNYGPDPANPKYIGYRWYWGQGLNNHCPDLYESSVF